MGDDVDKFRAAIRAVFDEWDELPLLPSNWYIQSVFDVERDRYALFIVDTEEEHTESRVLAYLNIRNGKIWMLNDNTEEGIAKRLLYNGISKSQIVLGFYPPELREMGDFAVS